MDFLSLSDLKTVMYTVLNLLSSDYLDVKPITRDASSWWIADKESVLAAARVVSAMTGSSPKRLQLLMDWMCSPSGAGAGNEIAIRRASVAVLKDHASLLETTFDKSLQQLADPLYIRHTPAVQQDGKHLAIMQD